MKRVLLFATTTGYQTRMFVQAAARAGLELTLATDRCEHLDDPWGDRAVAVRFDDPMGSLERIPKGFDAAVAIGDVTTFLAALYAERAGLRFHGPAAVEAAGNKYLAKGRFRAAGLLVPQFQRFPVDACPVWDDFPCVLKPLGMSGSRGVIRVDDRQQFVEAFERIAKLVMEPGLQNIAREPFVQVERFIPGEEVAIEGLVTRGELKVLAVFDKPDPLDGPYFEETIYVTPSRKSCVAEIVATVQRGVTALGLSDGPLHAEARVNGEGVWLLEIAGRPIGGLCAKALVFDDGMGLEELILRHACGEDVSGATREGQASGVMMIPIPRAGVYKGVRGVEAAQELAEVVITAKEGQKLVGYPEASSYLGFLFAKAPEAAQVEAALRGAHARLQFEILTVLV